MRTDAEVTAAAERLRKSRLTWGTHPDRWGDPEWQEDFWTEAAEIALADLTAERDRARAIAVALEGQVAAVRALAEEWAAHTNDEELPWAHRVRWTVILAKLHAALDPAEEET